MFLEGIVFAVGIVLVVAAGLDIYSRKIPNWIPLTIFGLFVVFLLVQWYQAPEVMKIAPLSSLATGLGVFVVFTAFFAFGWLGGGDVKLISAMGFWAGQEYIIEFVLLMAVLGGVVAVFYFLISTVHPDFEINPDKVAKKTSEKSLGEKEITSKDKIKKVDIPYGVAISAAGLFVVNQLLTILSA